MKKFFFGVHRISIKVTVDFLDSAEFGSEGYRRITVKLTDRTIDGFIVTFISPFLTLYDPPFSNVIF
jgi:hypothetical protein